MLAFKGQPISGYGGFFDRFNTKIAGQEHERRKEA